MQSRFLYEEQLSITKLENFKKSAGAAIVDPPVTLLVRRLSALAYDLIFGISNLYEPTATPHSRCEGGCRSQEQKN